MDTLGEGYSPDVIRAVIAGKREHTPKECNQKKAAARKRTNNLIIDIQEKMRAGKGRGYEHWATLHNLKQMAQTVLYLEEHNLLDYDELTRRASSASAQFSELSNRIKFAEKRMAEIAVMQKQIINYGKTRDTYVAYRKNGYSKSLQAEYATLIKEKKTLYPEYRKVREDMKELLTAKANIDRFLNYDEYREILAESKEKEAEQR